MANFAKCCSVHFLSRERGLRKYVLYTHLNVDICNPSSCIPHKLNKNKNKQSIKARINAFYKKKKIIILKINKCWQFSLTQIEYPLGNSSKKGNHVFFLLIVAMVLILLLQIVLL